MSRLFSNIISHQINEFALVATTAAATAIKSRYATMEAYRRPQISVTTLNLLTTLVFKYN